MFSYKVMLVLLNFILELSIISFYSRYYFIELTISIHLLTQWLISYFGGQMHGGLCLVYEAGLPQGGVVPDGRAGGGEEAGQRLPGLQPALPLQRHQGVQRTSGEYILDIHMDQ